MTIRRQLLLAFGALAGLCLLVALLAVTALGQSNEAFVSFAEGSNQRSQLLSRLGGAMKDRAIATQNLLLANSPAEREQQAAAASAAHKEVQELLGRFNSAVAAATDMDEAAKQAANEAKQLEQTYAPIALNIINMGLTGDRDEASTRMNADGIPLLVKMNKLLRHDTELAEQDAQNKAQAAQASMWRWRLGLMLVSALALFASLAVAGVIIRNLLSALGAEPVALRRAVGRVANGDLSDIEGGETARPGSVLASVVTMQASLVALISHVRDAANQIATASSEIAVGSLDLSNRTESQAASLEETSATMATLSDTVRLNAQSAEQANHLARGASEIAVEGGKIFGQVVDTMKAINSSSHRIEDIISVIDGIAFQTNILALNAAVEAARAGEQGKGFAVVASEVRSLAQRAANAAKEIHAQIATSVQQVEDGSSLVDQAGVTMGRVLGAIQQVSEIVNTISSASKEQSQGVSQIGETVTQLDQATQQNAALVEQSAAAAESLQQQARAMIEVVATFKLQH
ncbi:MAG: MCP four helix bundle domain-containing protein [Burkholderiaceae bacterium]|nr:MCP four helix bundle domain-containing protein [Burkholderiaceae bacterium]